MSTMLAAPIETPIGEVPAFDTAAFIKARNEGKELPKADPKPDVKVEPVKAVEPEVRLPRSQRRQLNAAIRDAAEARGRLAVLEEMIAAGKISAPAKETIAVDAEPLRAQFGSDAEYLRATQKWDKAQDAKAAAKEGETSAQSEQSKAHFMAMDEKATEDIKTLTDWDEVSKAAIDDEDAPELDPSEHPTLMGMLASSDVRAFALYHFAKHPEELQKMLDLSKTPNEQIRAFHRLEGKLEREYSNPKAAQAAEPEKGKKDRIHLAEAVRPGETATGAIPVKPKPSSEVTARGGSPAPDEPAIGSPAWMLKRNQAQYGH